MQDKNDTNRHKVDNIVISAFFQSFPDLLDRSSDINFLSFNVLYEWNVVLWQKKFFSFLKFVIWIFYKSTSSFWRSIATEESFYIQRFFAIAQNDVHLRHFEGPWMKWMETEKSISLMCGFLPFGSKWHILVISNETKWSEKSILLILCGFLPFGSKWRNKSSEFSINFLFIFDF